MHAPLLYLSLTSLENTLPTCGTGASHPGYLLLPQEKDRTEEGQKENLNTGSEPTAEEQEEKEGKDTPSPDSKPLQQKGQPLRQHLTCTVMKTDLIPLPATSGSPGLPGFLGASANASLNPKHPPSVHACTFSLPTASKARAFPRQGQFEKDSGRTSQRLSVPTFTTDIYSQGQTGQHGQVCLFLLPPPREEQAHALLQALLPGI